MAVQQEGVVEEEEVARFANDGGSFGPFPQENFSGNEDIGEVAVVFVAAGAGQNNERLFLFLADALFPEKKSFSDFAHKNFEGNWNRGGQSLLGKIGNVRQVFQIFIACNKLRILLNG